MPTPREAVWAHLRADPDVQALAGGRVYHVAPPTGATYPLLVINTVSNVDRRSLSGVAYTETRVQVTAIASTLQEAEAVAMAVRRSLEGFRGLLAGALPVLGCRVDQYAPIYQEDVGHVHYHVDVLVVHKGAA